MEACKGLVKKALTLDTGHLRTSEKIIFDECRKCNCKMEKYTLSKEQKITMKMVTQFSRAV